MTAVDFQCVQAGFAQILVHRTGAAVGQYVDRTCHRVSGHRQPARQRFQQHQAEGVGAAREHEHIRRRVDLGEFRLRQHAQIVDFRIARFKLRQLWAFAGHPFRTWQVELQESFDVLLDGDPADVQKDRARGIEHLRFLRPENFQIDAAGP